MCFICFIRWFKTKFSSDIKVLRFENGEEYINSKFSRFLQDRGIVYETTCPHTSQLALCLFVHMLLNASRVLKYRTPL